tara:strand:- start:21640 stop:23358 length:1719 start_codon:yes stop_codon:yes gene_type:complete
MIYSNISVLKFGSSFLKKPENLSNAVQEIYEVYRQGQKVVVVVSAMGKTTESLIAEAKKVHPEPTTDAHAYAELLATGEAHSACLLSLALQASGVSSTYLNVYELGLSVNGPALDADPSHLDDKKIRTAFEKYGVIVIAGFVGICKNQKVSLLGRGGSDLTAVFVAHQLQAKECILLKDVDGIYDSDPNLHTTARRFDAISWEKAIRLGSKIVQSKAITYAKNTNQTIRVTSSVRQPGTLIGYIDKPLTTSESKNSDSKPPVRVLLLGLGTVGRGVYNELVSRPETYDIRKIFIKDRIKHIESGIPDHLLVTDPKQIWNESEYDLVIELIGGTDLANTLISEALELGLDVVTANKALIATNGKQFQDIAQKNKNRILFSAAVGGSVPVLETIDNLLLNIPGEQKIKSITGVVNGTCNFILDQLIDGVDFTTALKKAQDLGFAEADPTFDISGADSAQKLSLLIEKAFGQYLDWKSYQCQGIENLYIPDITHFKENKKTIRLVAHCEKNGDRILAEVQPQVLDITHPLARTKNEENIFLIETEDGRKFELIGKGAGRVPTSRSVLADVYSINR